mgnify:FL=1|jgi:large subunit ribosomal protein L31
MKQEIHPNYTDIKMTCSCGNTFTTKSTMHKDAMNIDICSECHPFYTGKQRLVDTAGRVDRFTKRFGAIKKS